MSPARVTVIEPSFSNVFWVSPSTVSMDTSHCSRSDDTQMWVTANMARALKQDKQDIGDGMMKGYF